MSKLKAAGLAAVVMALASPPALAQSIVPSSAPVADQAAGFVLYEFCLRLFDGQPVTAERVAAQAAQAGLTAIGDIWSPHVDEASAVLVKWNEQPGHCRVSLFGPPNVGEGLRDAMTAGGWRQETAGQRV